MKNFVEELRWRGMIQDIMPETEEHLMEGLRLVGIMILKHFQNCGHKPYALVGGATGMIGDPSGKSAERNLLTEEMLAQYITGIKKQLAKFLDFESDSPNKAELINNYDWMKNFSFLSFIRDIGKHITVNYMMAKDSVKKRFDPNENTDGMSFTEFSYQLLQGYDFLHLYQEKNLTLQMGGSDQWGNITTGTELIRRIAGGKAYALTCPLITKADGTKFGKSEGGNVWLDPEKTSPYKFYQYWINTSDADAERYIKIFTMLPKEEIEQLTAQHSEAPHLRVLQNKLAEELTILVHGKAELDKAIQASKILFGNPTSDDLKKLDEQTFLEVFDGVPQKEVSKQEIIGADIVNLLSEKTGFLSSKGEAKRELAGNSISVNKNKVNESFVTSEENLINGKFLLLQKGKKNYFVVKVV